ncbi:hypothetical protein D9M68_797330 [compost metagenome]
MKNRTGIEGLEETELLLRVQTGDPLAFEAIYHRYARRLYVKLLQLLKDEELARDILQDIFIKIWDIRADIDPEQSFGALLYTIATNLSHNVFRKAARDAKMRKNLNNSESYTHIEEGIYQTETNQLLTEALNHLTPRQREIYTLHKLQGKSYKEISALLNISVSAINHHIQLANRQLKAVLQPQTATIIAILSASILIS